MVWLTASTVTGTDAVSVNKKGARNAEFASGAGWIWIHEMNKSTIKSQATIVIVEHENGLVFMTSHGYGAAEELADSAVNLIGSFLKDQIEKRNNEDGEIDE